MSRLWEGLYLFKDSLILNLHKIMRYDPLIQEICASIGGRADDGAAALADFEKQLDVDSATWGIDIYEKEYGIKRDISKPYADRRAVIKSKMRGAGKADVTLIKLVVASWTNGHVDVAFSDGTITVTFNDIVGVPSNLDDVKLALEKIKPAHLALVYVLLYNTWLQASSKTWNQLAAFTWGQVMSSKIF
jgi:hypothetical protein